MRRAPGSEERTPVVDPAAGPTGAALLLVAGEGTFATHVLGGGDLVIGRGEGCDVRLDHRVLSRRHAILRAGPPRTIQDLGSTNGTRVGGEQHRGGAPVPLAANDSFHIGPFSFVVVAGAASDNRSLSARDATRIVDPTPAGVPRLVRDVAATLTNVVILGETGVGKEVLAETVHALSGRSGAITRINCAALSDTLLESELFGHEKGAFTGAAAQKAGLLESADRGTVFLDEVGELPLSIQAKLLRAIEHREVLRIGATRPVPVDVRFVAATNRDLPAEVTAGRFRRDLFFRLDGMTLVIPPLRERVHLIGPLALGFLEAAGKRAGVQPRLDGAVLAALEAYPWPGNVRELRAVIERAVLLAGAGPIGVRHLSFTRSLATDEPPAVAAPPVAGAGRARPATPADDAPALVGLDPEQRAERARIIAALEDCAGNQTRAARALGMARTTLANKLGLYRIPRPRT
ncbi:MAG: sigma 54-interacting transcriptional regulator [Myxococcales bacterium]|nr:sigma 54-interacting transcriptional regulator [Myxococcales bacterium]